MTVVCFGEILMNRLVAPTGDDEDLYQFDKLQLHIQVGFDFAQPTFLERSRKEDL